MWNSAFRALLTIRQCRLFNFSGNDSTCNETNDKTSLKTTTIFSIPEILYEIFLYFDETLLRQSVLLVCRDWYLIAYPLLPLREVVWDDTQKHGNNRVNDVEKILTRLPGAFGLAWYSRLDRKGSITESGPWQKLVASVQRNFNHFQEQEQSRTIIGGKRILFQNLQRLEIGGSIDLGLATATLLPLLPSLTILKMRTHDRCLISVGSIFLACPRLEQLLISSLSFGAVELNWSWVPFGFSDGHNFSDRNNMINRGRKNNNPSQQHLQQQQLLIRSLTLENTSFDLSGLETIFSFTPNLRELKLIQLSTPRHTQYHQPAPSSSHSSSSSISAFFPRLKDALRRNDISLILFHYSLDSEPLSEERFKEIQKEICHPQTEQWSLWSANDLPSFFPTYMTHVSNVVTTLELLGNEVGRCPMTECKLHQYLCESPHLLHLKAPQTAFLVEHFDIYRYVDTILSEPRPPNPAMAPTTTSPSFGSTSLEISLPPIWKCRKLRTLHMAFRASTRIYPLSTLADPSLPSTLLHLRTRILFGYIVAVCPALRDLRIDTSFLDSPHYNIHEPKMYLALEGGFCLLSRLHYLERLNIDAVCRRVYYNSWELTWMLGCEEEEREVRIEDRRKLMSRLLKQQQGAESMVWTERGQSSGGHNRNVVSCSTCGTNTNVAISRQLLKTGSEVDSDNDRELRVALQSLGQLNEVIRVVDNLEIESQKEKSHCWPHLQKITLYYPNRYGLTRREKAIEQLVRDPETFFQALVRSTFS